MATSNDAWGDCTVSTCKCFQMTAIAHAFLHLLATTRWWVATGKNPSFGQGYITAGERKSKARGENRRGDSDGELQQHSPD